MNDEALAEYLAGAANHTPEEGFPRLSLGEYMELMNFIKRGFGAKGEDHEGTTHAPGRADDHQGAGWGGSHQASREALSTPHE